MAEQPSSPNDWVIRCHDKNDSYQRTVDFSDLAYGASDERSGAGSRRWAGGFRGRQALLLDLWPTIRAVLYPKPFVTIQHTHSYLRAFWRFLDESEGMKERNRGQNVIREIEGVAQIDLVHAVRWISPQEGKWAVPFETAYQTVFLLINAARVRVGLPEIMRPPAPKAATSFSVNRPTESQGLRMIHLLSLRVQATYARWARADYLADQGRNLLGIELDSNKRSGKNAFEFRTTEADAFATYRALIEITKNPLPSREHLMAVLGSSSDKFPAWWPRYPSGHARDGERVGLQELISGFYPTVDDVNAMVSLLMARSAWNPTTVFALDCRTDSAWHEEFSPDEMILHSIKNRGGSWQYARAKTNHPTQCYQLVKRCHERSSSLRSLLEREPGRCSATPVAMRSPWVAASLHGGTGKVYVATNDTRTNLALFLDKLVTDHNSLATNAHRLLPEKVRPSDFRDILLEWAYKHSNYNLLVTMWLAGHRTPTVTRVYLSTKAAAEESSALVVSVMTKTLEQIRVHRKLDLTRIRAEMDGMTLSKEAIDRLEDARRNRTYSGTGCTSPLSPPRNIDPTNPQDGKSPCRQGHRCTVCDRAVVFNDSMPWLARRLAELILLQREDGATKRFMSSDEKDMKTLRATLTQWPDADVEESVTYWLGKIERGEHIPIRFGGQH